MLILSRRAGEAIIVDDKVTLTVLSIKGRQVRIGIDAPEDISVHREEIYQKIKAGENAGFAAGNTKAAINPTNSPSESLPDQAADVKTPGDGTQNSAIPPASTVE